MLKKTCQKVLPPPSSLLLTTRSAELKLSALKNVDGKTMVNLNKTKDWALVQNAALVMKIKVLKLGLVR